MHLQIHKPIIRRYIGMGVDIEAKEIFGGQICVKKAKRKTIKRVESDIAQPSAS